MQRRALVTGGSRGIGAAIAQELASRGHRVVINYRSRQEEAEAVCEAIRLAGGDAQCVAFDVSEASQVAEAFAALSIDEDPFQIVVNNAGITRDRLFGAMKWEAWRDVTRVTLDGFFHVTQPLIMPMVRMRWGRVVNISSVTGVLGNPGQVNYCAAKAGLIGATKALAKEVAKKGVTVNAIAPGFIETEMTEGIDAKILLARVPAGRLGTVDEVAGLTGYLCSEEAAYLNGQVLRLDGALG
jgi:3-oxoacyl-[acyl-carrier protein] reductase